MKQIVAIILIIGLVVSFYHVAVMKHAEEEAKEKIVKLLQ